MWKSQLISFVLGMAFLAVLVQCDHGFARDDGRYAESPYKNWFNEQKVPGTDGSCCTTADGVQAQEDIRNGEYWVTFAVKQFSNPGKDAVVKEITIGPMLVPPGAVLTGANLFGPPVVWYYWEWNMAGKQTFKIRCFAPGAKS